MTIAAKHSVTRPVIHPPTKGDEPMAIVASYDWESDSFTHHGDVRQVWREVVAAVAAKAKAALPECNGRVEKAAAIVLNGDVELLANGKAKVASQSNGSTAYFVVNGECQCKDFPKAPQGFCKHVRFVHPKLAIS